MAENLKETLDHEWQRRDETRTTDLTESARDLVRSAFDELDADESDPRTAGAGSAPTPTDLAEDPRGAVDPSDLDYEGRVAYWRERTPDSYVEAYEELLSMNCLPRVAAAVCHYVAGLEGDAEPTSQSEIATTYDISEQTVGNWYPELTDKTPTHP